MLLQTAASSKWNARQLLHVECFKAWPSTMQRWQMREKIQKAARDMREQSLAHMTERFRLLQENSLMQQVLVECALGPGPAKAPAGSVAEINREAAQGKSYFTKLKWAQSHVGLHVHESNHNVSVWAIKKQPASDTAFPNGEHQGVVFRARFLHPHDATLAKEFRISSS